MYNSKSLTETFFKKLVIFEKIKQICVMKEKDKKLNFGKYRQDSKNLFIKKKNYNFKCDKLGEQELKK